jgi:hypothetical protein
MRKPRAWIWEWLPEGAEWSHPLMMAAWDQPSMRGYLVLHVIFPLNFIVRAAFLLRFNAWRVMRFGSKAAWIRSGSPNVNGYRCPHCLKTESRVTLRARREERMRADRLYSRRWR